MLNSKRIILANEKFISILVLMFSAVAFYSCSDNSTGVEPLIYSEYDVPLLNDSLKNIFYDNAAFIERCQMAGDTAKFYYQVYLNPDNVDAFYNDLLSIYKNSYKISNTFFRYAKSIRTSDLSSIYSTTLLVDTSKSWAANWKNGVKNTGIDAIDSLIQNYDLKIIYNFRTGRDYYYSIKSERPLNHNALTRMFMKTSEFDAIMEVATEMVVIGAGDLIYCETTGNKKLYTYHHGWGDCPAGCISHHYWVVSVEGNSIKLVEEGGDKLPD